MDYRIIRITGDFTYIIYNNEMNVIYNDKILFDWIYEYIFEFNAGVFQYKKRDLYGVIDIDGNIICENIYCHMSDFDDNNYSVVGIPIKNSKLNARYGIIDNKGNYIKRCEYDYFYIIKNYDNIIRAYKINKFID